MPYDDFNKSKKEDLSEHTESELDLYYKESGEDIEVLKQLLNDSGSKYEETDTDIRVEYYIDTPERRVHGRIAPSQRVYRWKIYNKNV